MNIHVVDILPLCDKTLLANMTHHRLFTVGCVVDFDMVADLPLLNLLSTMVTYDMFMVGFLVRVERVLALVSCTALFTLVNLIGMALRLVEPVPSFLNLHPALFASDQLVAVLSCHVALVNEFLVLFQIMHSLEHFAALSTLQKMRGI